MPGCGDGYGGDGDGGDSDAGDGDGGDGDSGDGDGSDGDGGDGSNLKKEVMIGYPVWEICFILDMFITYGDIWEHSHNTPIMVQIHGMVTIIWIRQLKSSCTSQSKSPLW